MLKDHGGHLCKSTRQHFEKKSHAVLRHAELFFNKIWIPKFINGELYITLKFRNLEIREHSSFVNN